MAKSSWKHVNYTAADFTYFFSELFLDKFFKGRRILNLRLKKYRINNLNHQHWYVTYGGKFNRFFFASISHVNYCLGDFFKTRKPFYFRSKKKKKNE